MQSRWSKMNRSIRGKTRNANLTLLETQTLCLLQSFVSSTLIAHGLLHCTEQLQILQKLGEVEHVEAAVCIQSRLMEAAKRYWKRWQESRSLEGISMCWLRHEFKLTGVLHLILPRLWNLEARLNLKWTAEILNSTCRRHKKKELWMQTHSI